jgi:hypothetical protein
VYEVTVFDDMLFSKLRSWAVQRVANLGLVAVLLLMLVAFWHNGPNDKDRNGGSKAPGDKKHHHQHRARLTTSQLVFVYYTLFVHTLGFLFPMRLCWATGRMIQNLRKTATDSSYFQLISRENSEQRLKNDKRGTYEDSVSSSESSGSDTEIELSSSAGTELGDEPLLHAIIIPNYKEELDTLRETLDIFASHYQAGSSYEVCWKIYQGLAE